ncbi:unnamed protein product [Candidula unifasciata]|uniref:Transmembrane protein 254 n=1 Tax=Candidula unifasciata TaxID=100452 RepID=A0A8S3YHC4_9EUPU|nr:unnamed protein product [Candidula unifasciata]
MAVEKRSKDGPKKKISPPQQRQIYDPRYFAWPSRFWMLFNVFGIGLLIASTLSPARIPTFLGPIATYGRFMGTTYPNACVYLCAFTLIAHITQAAFAGKVCHDRGMATSTTVKWVFSTLLFGFSSLVLRLLPHKPVLKTA